MDTQSPKERINYLLTHKMTTTKKIAKSWYNISEIKLYIKKMLTKTYRDVFMETNDWLDNPNKQKKDDKGLVINNIWSKFNYADTNYSGWVIIFNTATDMFIKECIKLGVEKMIINGVEFDKNNPIVFDISWNNDLEKLKIKLREQMILVWRYRKEIFKINGEIFNKLMDTFDLTSGIGGIAENFYEMHINVFSSDIIKCRKTTGTGDYFDRTEGVDFWITDSKGKTTTHQVKSCCNIIETDNDFIISVGLSDVSKCDYIVIICTGNRILIFKNEIDRESDERGFIFPKSILYKEKRFYE